MKLVQYALAQLRLGLVWLMALVVSPVMAQQNVEPSAVWSAWGGEAEFQLDPVILSDLKLSIGVEQGR